jgi:hypothetical protein
MILIIGYGSLMSRFGLDYNPSTQNISIFNPFIVRFQGIRNFNTKWGRYMDIGKNFNFIGERVNINELSYNLYGYFECLAYSIKYEDISKIARREGYPGNLIRKLKSKLEIYNEENSQDLDLAEFLWTFYPNEGFKLDFSEKIQQYRKELGSFVDIDILSMGSYIPHPVKLMNEIENNKSYGLISIHTDIGAKGQDYNIEDMTFSKAIRSDNPPRDTYLQECILGGVHGIDMRDILNGINLHDQKLDKYLTNFRARISEEWKKTQDWEFHGDDLFKNLSRSGMSEKFPNIVSELENKY